MKIRVLGCDGGVAPSKLTTSFQITESLLIDAGSPATALELPEQRQIRDIVLSHIHVDHIKDLAFLADNLLGDVETIRIHALPEVNAALRKHFFNGLLWPDFTKLPDPKKPFYQLHDISSEQELQFGSVQVTPVAVHHSVPALGFIVRDATTTVVLSGDTGPTERLWERSRDLERVDGFICEVAFPSSQQVIADGAKHFTPATLKAELPKFERPGVPVWLYHLKPRYAEEMLRELKGLANPNFRYLKSGEVLQF